MNAKNNSYKPQYAVNDAQRIKTVGLRIGATHRNLEAKIKEAFALAKSAGRELNLTFGADFSTQNTINQLHVQ